MKLAVELNISKQNLDEEEGKASNYRPKVLGRVLE
jgi:hypothetical protein